MRPTGAQIHFKYRELGGLGILIGNEPPHVLAEQTQIQLDLEIWIREETAKPEKKPVMGTCKVCNGVTNNFVRMFTTLVPICWKCEKEIAFRYTAKKLVEENKKEEDKTSP